MVLYSPYPDKSSFGVVRPASGTDRHYTIPDLFGLDPYKDEGTSLLQSSSNDLEQNSSYEAK